MPCYESIGQSRLQWNWSSDQEMVQSTRVDGATRPLSPGFSRSKKLMTHREWNGPWVITDCFRSAIELKDNTVIVVLGASGDLAKKKTVSRQREQSFFPPFGLSIG